jgi:flagellar protein FliL
MSAEAQAKPAVAGAAAGEEGTETAAPKKKSPLRLYALIGLVVLALGGGGGWFFMTRPRPHAAPHEPEAKPLEPVKVTASLGSLVVNIGAPETRRFLKVGVDLGVSDEKAAKEVEEHKSQILDLLISVLATASLEVLGSEEGRTGIKKAVVERIHEELRLEKVSRVYFTEFLIQ